MLFSLRKALNARSFRSFNPEFISPEGVTRKPKYLYSRVVSIFSLPKERCVDQVTVPFPKYDLKIVEKDTKNEVSESNPSILDKIPRLTKQVGG